jgi:hypothetical protein
MEPDFVGIDPQSPDEECPAVFVDPVTGDLYQQGKLVTDPQILARFAEHSPLGADEAVVWQPGRLAPFVAEAANRSHEQGRQGPGTPTFAYLLEHTKRSVVHLELRDQYDATVPAFLDWKAGRESVGYDWHGYPELVASAVGRGVRFRRARIVSEPVTDYIRWEHSITDVNVKAGEQVRWLSRWDAAELMLPGADFWMFDQRIVRFNFTGGDGVKTGRYKFTTDPRIAAQLAGAFEMVWERATPHEDYHP